MRKKGETQKGSRIWQSRGFCIVATTVILWVWGDIAQPQATSCQVGTYDCAGQLYLSNGNVGVGTTTPSAKLDVRGYNILTDPTSSYNNHFPHSDNNAYLTGNMIHLRGGAPQGWATRLMVDTNTGNVGIGTSSPGASLDVAVGSTQCCATQVPNISLAQGSNANGQMSWLQFHNAGEAEAYIRLAGGGPAGSPRAGQRRLEIGDSQGVTTGLTVTGNIAAGGGFTQPGTGGETLKIIRGNVNSVGTILSGTGFTIQRNSTGNYTITFSTAFSGIPTVVAVSNLVPYYSASVDNQSTSQAQIHFRDTEPNPSVPVNSAFTFIAVGPP